MSAENNTDNRPAADRNQLPNDIEAEQAVIATCMLNSDACDEILISLKPGNFYRPAHRIIFESIYEMSTQGLTPDVISLADKLQAKGQLEAAGDRTYLADLNTNTFALTNWQRHMEIVKRTSIQRELIKAAAEINALAYDAPEDLNEVVDQAEHTLFKVTENAFRLHSRKWTSSSTTLSMSWRSWHLEEATSSACPADSPMWMTFFTDFAAATL